jgi:hypothetical protein
LGNPAFGVRGASRVLVAVVKLETYGTLTLALRNGMIWQGESAACSDVLRAENIKIPLQIPGDWADGTAYLGSKWK